MLLGHTAFSEQAFSDAMLSVVHNLTFAEGGNVATFSIGTEVATGGANVSPDGSSATASVGDETTLGESFQNLITFSTGDLDLTIWNEVDDSETSTWTLVDPGSTD
jgi:hypothetical protein